MPRAGCTVIAKLLFVSRKSYISLQVQRVSRRQYSINCQAIAKDCAQSVNIKNTKYAFVNNVDISGDT